MDIITEDSNYFHLFLGVLPLFYQSASNHPSKVNVFLFVVCSSYLVIVLIIIIIIIIILYAGYLQ